MVGEVTVLGGGYYYVTKWTYCQMAFRYFLSIPQITAVLTLDRETSLCSEESISLSARGQKLVSAQPQM